MNIVAKVKCQCKRWVRIRDHKVPTDEVKCWNCHAVLQITWINRNGGNAKITYQGVTKTIYDVDIESLEMP